MMEHDPRKIFRLLVYAGAVGGMAAWMLFVVPSDLRAIIFSAPLGLSAVGYSILLLQKVVLKTHQTVHFVHLHHDTTVCGYLVKKVVE